MSARFLVGDALTQLATLPAGGAQACVTSPPYFGLRDYGVAGQLGLERTPEEYVANLVAVFREVRRVLRDDGTLWINLGDSYANDWKWGGATGGKHISALHGSQIGRAKRDTGLPPKSLMLMPARVALALQADGWILRSEIIWHKPHVMPESVGDRPTKSHETLWLLAKQPTYYYDAAAIAEPVAAATIADRPNDGKRIDRGYPGALHRGNGRLGDGETRNKRSVWTVASQPFKGAHFATFPPALIEPCILAGSRRGDVVLDPFGGAGTTAIVADRLGRDSILVELNPDYAAMAEARLVAEAPLWNTRSAPEGAESNRNATVTDPETAGPHPSEVGVMGLDPELTQ